jgi:hypothetical protein
MNKQLFVQFKDCSKDAEYLGSVLSLSKRNKIAALALIPFQIRGPGVPVNNQN